MGLHLTLMPSCNLMKFLVTRQMVKMNAIIDRVKFNNYMIINDY